MFVGLYALEPGFTDYQSPLCKFLVPGDVFDDTAMNLLVDMLRRHGVEVRSEHDFSSDAVFDGEKEPDMHLLIFPPPVPFEIACRIFWTTSVMTFLWYALGYKPIRIPKCVLKEWLREGEMAFIVGPLP